jgi:hypothetical protein
VFDAAREFKQVKVERIAACLLRTKNKKMYPGPQTRGKIPRGNRGSWADILLLRNAELFEQPKRDTSRNGTEELKRRQSAALIDV